MSVVALLGFLPLIVVHWSDRRPKLHVPRGTLKTIVAIKTSILVGLTDWLLSFAL